MTQKDSYCGPLDRVVITTQNVTSQPVVKNKGTFIAPQALLENVFEKRDKALI